MYKISVYDSCPVYITHRFTLRLVRREDAPGLLKVYSDKQAQAYFNSDNCTSDFRYETLPEMQRCVDMWVRSYQERQFVRWTILHDGKPVGTVEMFRRDDGPDGQGLGILRIDLMSRYEFPDVFDEILKTMLPELHEHFGCKHILTKALPYMERRRVSLILHGFVPVKKPLIVHNGIEYGHYWAHRYVAPGE